MIQTALYRSESGEWETPEALFARVEMEYGPLMLDVCATADSAKCPRYFDREADGLSQQWDVPYWCNPPYGRDVRQWIEKGIQSRPLGVFLLPARTDTAWFHDLLYHHRLSEAAKGLDHVPRYGAGPRLGINLIFLRGRVRFVGAKSSAPFPSVLAVLNGPLTARRHTHDHRALSTSPSTHPFEP